VLVAGADHIRRVLGWTPRRSNLTDIVLSMELGTRIRSSPRDSVDGRCDVRREVKLETAGWPGRYRPAHRRPLIDPVNGASLAPLCLGWLSRTFRWDLQWTALPKKCSSSRPLLPETA
jgi:hypothetical protein